MTDLAAFLNDAWQKLSRGVADRRAPARHLTFATVSPAGWPEARTVVLRAARPSLAELDIHTDIASLKMASLHASPKAELHVWDPKANFQIRAQALVTVRAGANAAEEWDKVPDASRAGYGTTPSPGTPIAEATAFEKPSVQENFAVLTCRIERFDLLELSTPHKRAVFQRADDWAGNWVAP